MNRKNILITGASSGLGKMMAKMFAAKDRNLALCARRVDALEEFKTELETAYPNIQVIVKALDVNDHDRVFIVFKEFAEELGQLDRVIVNAGMGKGAPLGTGYFHANKATATTNFVSAIAQCEAALELFRKQNFGHLVTISSVIAARGFGGAMSVYAATKAALTSLSEGIRIDLLDTPIQITTIHPGYIRSEINEKVKNVPFIVGTETGTRTIVNAIEKEGANYYVPSWPWLIMNIILKVLPLRLLAKMS